MAEPAEIQTIPTLNPGSAPGPEHYISLAALLRTLAALLTVADAKPALLQTQPMRLIEQARLLNSTADVLRIHVTYFSDAAAKDRSKLIAQSLVFIARYVDTWALPPKYAAPINGVIEKVVQLALAISAGR